MLTLDHIHFAYTDKEILSGFSMILQDGEQISLMGASGSGKSTLLHLISGIFTPTGGEIISDHKKISYVFQEPRLLPWLTVKENILAVLPSKGKENEKKVADALEFVELENVSESFPSALSGGMKARVSLARALAYEGDLFLLDEPFAALDLSLRDRLLSKLLRRFRENNITAILVTHDEADAKHFSERIVTL